MHRRAAVEPIATVVIGTVQGDLHDVGKNLVAMMWKGAGFNVVDVGTDVRPETFIEAAEEYSADLVGLSALLTTTMPMMERIVTTFREAGMDTKVVVGGAPITQKYCDKIGAAGYSADAASAVDIAKELLGV